eukprot:Phypoly_transcript_08434.p2 GENE.Phypoly_transcript_08434~~Phypoly_transcript_08434.p2  ORF type:complete len:178 (+),score=22.93 Phypoly_transcript_08434:29-535(+)
MEQCEGFKQVVAKIKELETQLARCKDATQLCENSTREAENEIEEHFAMLANALALRKAELLGQVQQKASAQKQLVVETHKQLETSIKSCVHILEAASLMYTVNVASAESVWKSIATVKFPSVIEKLIKISFDNSLLKFIKAHSTVDYHSTYQGLLVNNLQYFIVNFVR